jgi:hypothetical protein
MDDVNEPSSSNPTSNIDDAPKVLEELSRRAQLEMESQPLPTQFSLARQTRQIFNYYSQQGTASSLRSAITKYYKASHSQSQSLTFSPALTVRHHRRSRPARSPQESRMVDEESRHLVRAMPFHVARKLHIRPNVMLPEGLLEGIDRIMRIYQAEAEAMLTHHCDKYGDEAIFRLGIRSLFLR